MQTETKVVHRLDSIDLLRGIAMVIMALDHVRDFFAVNSMGMDPTDLTKTNTALFLTRWITHFCAPVFFFLAGTGAFLSTLRGKTRPELAKFLVTRGLWLVFLELTIINWFGWSFSIELHDFGGLVIWALGWSMVALAGLIYLPRRILLAFSLIMIFGHNLLDKIKPEVFGKAKWVWIILHQQGGIGPAKGFSLGILYPLIPWIGVMAAGYLFGEMMLREPAERQKRVLKLGALLTVLFIVIRGINLYGDPVPWAVQKNWYFTILSFLNCYKYPPSLLYLLMTLGPALIVLALLDKSSGWWTRIFLPFGRVPMFYYLLHLPLIHGAAVIFFVLKYGIPKGNPTDPQNPFNVPADYGYSLPVVYLIWIGVVLLLYPACKWFSNLKKRRKDPWLSYL